MNNDSKKMDKIINNSLYTLLALSVLVPLALGYFVSVDFALAFLHGMGVGFMVVPAGFLVLMLLAWAWSKVIVKKT